jgi:hypothetical protein
MKCTLWLAKLDRRQKFPQPSTINLDHGVILGFCLHPANGFHGNLGIPNG